MSRPSPCEPAERRPDPPVPAADVPLYRERTLALLRRYFRLSIEIGRLPNLLGREVFRARTSLRGGGAFENAVILVHDMERCLDALDALSRTLIVRIVFQDFTHRETARLLHCNLRTISRRFPESLDLLSALLLRRQLLQPFPSTRRPAKPPDAAKIEPAAIPEIACQEAPAPSSGVSRCNHDEYNFAEPVMFEPPGLIF